MNDKTDIFFILLSAFFSGFVVGLNSKANEEGVTLLKFYSKILVHGVSGTIVGLFLMSFETNIYLICAMSGLGGLLGQEILEMFFKIKPTKTDGKKNDSDDDNNPLDGYYDDL